MSAVADFSRFMLVRRGGEMLNTRMATPQLKPVETDYESLLQAVGQDRDRDAFITLFQHFAPRLKSFLMKNGTGADQAEELMQDTMLTVWNRAASYDHTQASASTWIFTIARNRKIDVHRKGSHIEFDKGDPAFVPDHAPAAAPDSGIAEIQRTDRIAKAIKTLPGEQAALLQKSFFEDKTHMEIAAETQLPLGTVKSRIRLALDRLRGQLDQELLS